MIILDENGKFIAKDETLQALQILYGERPYFYQEGDDFRYPLHCYTPVKQVRWYGGYSLYTEKYTYGWLLSKEAAKEAELQVKAQRLYAKGWLGHRKGPVPNVHYHKNHPSARNISGLKREHTNTVDCQQEYGNTYGNLIRTKRASLVYYLVTDYDAPDHFNKQRGWKRSKKRKQWM